ncbi:YjbE family putative metal transport protein [Alterisphingorhabdus coralli]|uniref:YjbE family putative metal transport protein n=1 Tax=Alterisphingorhabdus coralli TaxID=3071408 RepID=A0AA97F7P5_9SPHN|nr:YjbE family putative metal transport protein [Parasphingorhabdus sp. SCSIO 66989]WOE75451.1 YjbE family putative metal transport protein [Parasphingorhabdus sp. SCSIO 66989]
MEILTQLAQASAFMGGYDSFGALWLAIMNDLSGFGSPSSLWAFGQVILIDLVFAADNAIVVGALAAGLPADQRRKVILIGISAALVLRIVFALMVSVLLGIVGLILAGGLLLLWVAWRFWREIREMGGESEGSPEIEGDEDSGLAPSKSFWGAVWAVTAADVSMSLDNVLGVAGAAREHPGILVIGLLLSVALMGLAANIIAKYIERYKWIAYLGLLVIIYVACTMIYDGFVDPNVGLMQLAMG